MEYKQDIEKSDGIEETKGETQVFQIKHGFWRTYDATDGLPGQPNSLLQDRYGYLWIGTDAGLCRYDGIEFFTYTIKDGLLDNVVTSLCQDNQGRLWIGIADKGISCFDGKRFTNYNASKGLVNDRVIALYFDSRERLWIGTSDGLSCLDKNGFTNYTTDNGLPDNSIHSICEDKKKRLWFGTENGLVRFDGRSFKTYTTADGLHGNHIFRLCIDNQGRIWSISGGLIRGVSCFDGKHFKTYTSDDGLIGPQNLFMAMFSDHLGRMWFGGWDGASCFDGKKFVNYTIKDGIRGVFNILEDRGGQMWFAHGMLSYLSCFDEKTIQVLTDQSNTWASDQDKRGRIWFNFGNDIYAISPNPTYSEVEQRKIPFPMGMIGLVVDSSDRLWISPYTDGVYRYDSTDIAWKSAGGEVTYEPRHFNMPDDSPSNNIVPLLEMKDGTIWFVLSHQLFLFHPERFMEEDPIEFIDIAPSVTRPIEDRKGRLWIGGQNNKALFCWYENKLTSYAEENGLIINQGIESLFEDDDKIWIGTTHGLWQYNGERFIHCEEEYGLRDLYHWHYIVKDQFDQIWFSTRGGVYRTDGKHFQWLTKEDGLPSNNVTNILPQPDGSIIICTDSGIVRYRMTARLTP